MYHSKPIMTTNDQRNFAKIKENFKKSDEKEVIFFFIMPFHDILEKKCEHIDFETK